MSYYQECAIPKPRPRALEKQDRTKRKKATDDKETAKVKKRSGGQCELKEVVLLTEGPKAYYKRCVRRASETHHLLGGTGRRGVKESALAKNKLHLCGICHDLVTRHILQGSWTDVNDRAGTITFVKLK